MVLAFAKGRWHLKMAGVGYGHEGKHVGDWKFSDVAGG